MVKRFLRALLMRWTRALAPPPDHEGENRVLKRLLANLTPDESTNFHRFREMASEMVEA